jgi:hypothetical protein
MMQNRECAQLLTDAKDYHIVVGKQSMLQTIRTQVRSDMKSIVMCHAQNLEHYTLKTKRLIPSIETSIISKTSGSSNLILTAIIFATTCIHKIVNNNDRWII